MKSMVKVGLPGVLLVLVAAAVASAAAGDVLGLQVLDGRDATRVEIATAGEVTLRNFRMAGPDRFVVDVLGAINRMDTSPSLPQGCTLLREVRTSQYSLEPQPVTRLVFGVAPQVAAEVERTRDGIAVTFRHAGQDGAGLSLLRE